jgi:hypothetical protein
MDALGAGSLSDFYGLLVSGRKEVEFDVTNSIDSKTLDVDDVAVGNAGLDVLDVHVEESAVGWQEGRGCSTQRAKPQS